MDSNQGYTAHPGAFANARIIPPREGYIDVSNSSRAAYSTTRTQRLADGSEMLTTETYSYVSTPASGSGSQTFAGQPNYHPPTHQYAPAPPQPYAPAYHPPQQYVPTYPPAPAYPLPQQYAPPPPQSYAPAYPPPQHYAPEYPPPQNYAPAYPPPQNYAPAYPPPQPYAPAYPPPQQYAPAYPPPQHTPAYPAQPTHQANAPQRDSRVGDYDEEDYYVEEITQSRQHPRIVELASDEDISTAFQSTPSPRPRADRYANRPTGQTPRPVGDRYANRPTPRTPLHSESSTTQEAPKVVRSVPDSEQDASSQPPHPSASRLDGGNQLRDTLPAPPRATAPVQSGRPTASAVQDDRLGENDAEIASLSSTAVSPEREPSIASNTARDQHQQRSDPENTQSSRGHTSPRLPLRPPSYRPTIRGHFPPYGRLD